MAALGGRGARAQPRRRYLRLRRGVLRRDTRDVPRLRRAFVRVDPPQLRLLGRRRSRLQGPRPALRRQRILRVLARDASEALAGALPRAGRGVALPDRGERRRFPRQRPHRRRGRNQFAHARRAPRALQALGRPAAEQVRVAGLDPGARRLQVFLQGDRARHPARALLPIRKRREHLDHRDERRHLGALGIRHDGRGADAARARAPVRGGARRPQAARQPLSVAHFSIGSGTKLAMEDAIALFDSLRSEGGVRGALALYDSQRREDVEKTQHAADVSLAWFENMVLPPGFEVQVRNPPPPMFTPFTLRGMRLENRVVVSPMDQYMAADGMPDDWHLVHLGSRAVGGAGLVFVEMTCPSPEARISPGCTGLWNEAQRDAFRRIVDFCHAQSGAKLCMQLGHSGRKGSTQLGWERMDYPLESGNWDLVAPSPLPYHAESRTLREMTRADMDRIRDDFVRSARYADAAGFDMVELHMAHGYLLSSFISPLTNLRKDEYGGSIRNRLRYPMEVFRAVRAVWPEEKPMSIRISATDWAPGGLSEEDLLALARAFKEAGVDLIDVSTGQVVPQQKPVYGRMYQTPFADKVRNEIGLATMAVGNITSADQVNTIVVSGRADLVALARPHLADPYFTLRAAAWYQHSGQFWPKPYLQGRDQAYRLAVRDREEWTAGRQATKPPSHEAKDEPAQDERAAKSGGGPGKKAA